MKRSSFLAAFLLMTGCAPVGVWTGGETKTYSETYSITSTSPVDVVGRLDIIAEKTGFSVQKVDKDAGIAQLGRGLSGTYGFTGVSKTGEITISGINTNALKVVITLTGNHDYGSKKNTDALFNDLQTILHGSVP